MVKCPQWMGSKPVALNVGQKKGAGAAFAFD
jgi:hypothetical protein